MRRILLLATMLVLPGLVGMLIFGYYALIDWTSLQKAYQYFSDVVQSSSTMEKLFIAEAQQNIHRINLFADGVWTLLSAILAAIGLHGICVLPNRSRTNGS
jgi:ABC-type polysaccharide transport system permease subunit